MAKYIIAVDDSSYYEIHRKKPGAIEIEQFIVASGYDIDHIVVYELINKYSISRTYSLKADNNE